MRNNRALVITALVALVAVVTLLIVRSNRDPGNGRPDGRRVRIGFVVTTLSNPFFVDMVDGAKQQAQSLQSVDIVVQAPEQASDNERQMQIIEGLISQKVDAICVVPADSKSVVASVAKADAAGIPFINVDNRINEAALKSNGATVEAYVGSDNYDGGKLAGAFMAKKLGGKGKVAILEGVSGVEAGAQRKAGFLEALKASPGIQVVASQPADWSREKGLNVFQSIYQAHPDLQGLFACNDEMALGAIRALQSPRQVVVVGFDATKDAVDAVQSGEMDATVAQMPAEMGRAAVSVAAKAAARESFQPVQMTPLRLVTKE